MDTANNNGPRESGGKHRRRRYLINRAFQWKCAGWIMLNVTVICSFTGVLMLSLLERFLRSRMLNPESSGAWEVATIVVAFAGVFALLAAGAFGLWSIIFTHRICGPLFVLGRHIDDLIRGRIPRWRPLRKKDAFKDFHAHFCRMLDSMRSRRQTDLNALNEILEALHVAEHADERARRQALRDVVNRLAQIRTRTCAALGEPVEDGLNETGGHPASAPTPTTRVAAVDA